MTSDIKVVVSQPAPIAVIQVAQQGPMGPVPVLKTLDGQSLFGSGDIATWHTYQQNSPSAVWVIQHNLNKYPSVTVVDSAGTWVIGEVVYNDTNTITISFNGTFSGKAFFN